jgi:hypothetical protein
MKEKPEKYNDFVLNTIELELKYLNERKEYLEKKKDNIQKEIYEKIQTVLLY